MTFDVNAVQQFANWFHFKTGVKLGLGEAFSLFEKHERGENVLWSQLPREQSR